MPSKTISLELEAYNRLKATCRPGESFSAVVKRITLPSAKATLRDLKREVDSGEFAQGVDWGAVKHAVENRRRSRDIRKTS
tara:strand:- start:612 stop:854 length:243 start_codon:yes stop_codon:yes gene_type:complete